MRMTVLSEARSWKFVRWGHALVSILGAIVLLLSPSDAVATRLCFLPPSLPFEEDDERFEMLEEKVSSVFESAGFEITGSEEVREVYQPVKQEWGEVFDPLTGRTSVEKQFRFQQEVGGAYRDALGCDALVRVSLALVRARYAMPFATWDGTKRRVMSTERTLVAALFGISEFGWVSALSIWIRLMDPEGNAIGFRSAGVEPLVEITFSRNLDKLPEDRWLRDEVGLDRAIESALGIDAEWMRSRGTSSGPIDADALAWPGA